MTKAFNRPFVTPTLDKSSEMTTGAVDPIPMLLFCPECGRKHIDESESDEAYRKYLALGGMDDQWLNPPHRSHLCHTCGCVWRPADVATTGVASLSTQGSADTWPVRGQGT